MIYKLLRIIANIAIRVFYGKIEIDGLEKIPSNGPLLIASNHPNGFLEPIIMACLFARPLHFMVRGDVFEIKWLRPLLRATNQIPIFRAKDGFSELRKNQKHLSEAHNVLRNNGALLIFIEGGTESIKTLRPFQKGLARLALSFVETDANSDLQILPVGINFISPAVFRSRVSLNIGTPISAQSYFEQKDSKQKLKDLTQEIYDRVLPLAFHVKHSEKLATLDRCLWAVEGLYTMPFLPMVSHQSSYWATCKNVSNAIQQKSIEEVDLIAQDLSIFSNLQPQYVKRKIKSPLVHYFWSLLLLNFGVTGWLINILPGYFSYKFALSKVPKGDPEFEASLIVCIGLVIYLLFYFVGTVVFVVLFGWSGWLFLLGIPLGFCYLAWKNGVRNSFLRKKYSWSAYERDQIVGIFTKHNIELKL